MIPLTFKDAAPIRIDAAPQLRLHDPSPPAAVPLLVDARRLAALLCCGLRTLRTWDSAGRLPAPLRIGGRVCWRLGEIIDWLDAGAPDRDEWVLIRKARK